MTEKEKIIEAIDLYDKITDLLSDDAVSMTIHVLNYDDIPMELIDDVGKLDDNTIIFKRKNKHNEAFNITLFLSQKDKNLREVNNGRG